MFSSKEVITLLGCLGIGQFFVLMPCVRDRLSRHIRGRFGRFVFGLAIGVATYVGGTKTPPGPASTLQARFAQALADGSIANDGGAIAGAAQAKVIADFAALSQGIVAAATNTVDAASNEFDRVAGLVTNSERRVIYVSSYLPRSGTGPGGETNHNIAATIERLRPSAGGTNLTAWVWFSKEPFVSPGMRADIDVGAGSVLLANVTNSFPETEAINGVPCVRYEFAVPQAARGTPFIPAYEVGWGSVSAPLIIPAGGVLVSTNGVQVMPFTGIDTHFTGRVTVRYVGGIAVSVTIDGEAVTNGVHHL